MNNKAKIDCVDRESRTNETGASVAVESVSVEKRQGLFEERPLPVNEIDPRVLRYRSRRDFLLFGAGAMAALAGGGFLLPQDTLRRMGVRRTVDSPAKQWFLNRALRIDDDVAEAFYSGNRRVPTYTKSQITPLKNNYNGSTPESRLHFRMEPHYRRARFRLEHLSRYSESDDPLLSTGANYAAGVRRRMECDRLVGWFEIR